jgi:hypothetical protein
VSCDYLGEILGQATQLCTHSHMQRTRVHAIGDGRLILPTRQTRSSGFSRTTGPFGSLLALPIDVAFRTATTLLPELLIKALGRPLPRPTSPRLRSSGPL